MLNWGEEVPRHHPLRTRYPHRYLDQALPEDSVPGIHAVLVEFHRRLLDLQTRFLRIVAAGLGVADGYFDDILADGSHLTRAIHYPPMTQAPAAEYVWADAHTDINLVTALPRARPVAACSCRRPPVGTTSCRPTATWSSTPESCSSG